MSKASSPTTTKISSFMLMIIFIVLALSLTAIILAINAWYTPGQELTAGYLLLIGVLGVAMSTYILFQTKKRMLRLKIEAPSITTTIECRKCDFKSIREFQRGDYIFKEVEPCQKCNVNMLITAIYREVKERKRERFPF
ncbi:MAG: hypothetical protein QMD13_03385 [Candidatus Bathyarchaeia archaeon]|nr:hypothetical protein [Candidatus Bathyarchaeia archaeon]MDI6904523.1 hypothetical protein [Candidatus Bathyarchaeia archaeon]